MLRSRTNERGFLLQLSSTQSAGPAAAAVYKMPGNGSELYYAGLGCGVMSKWLNSFGVCGRKFTESIGVNFPGAMMG